MVAENWRYAGAMQKAREVIADIGKPLLANWAIHVQMTPENKYYHTPWRRDESFPGGFLLDGGVHHAAAWRFLLGEVESVTAMTAQQRDDLPPVDTLSAALRFQSGLLATFGVTYAGSAPEDTTLNVIGESGAIHVNRDRLMLITHTSRQEFRYEHADGIYSQFVAFAEALLNGKPHLNPPQEALGDVALIEALLQSAESGQRVDLRTS
ncbi:MAG: Gfo/Idh/MocA family oxidoreductase, partial [Anaerolineae bacterium]|nr:Gfo/Idh/MocA family oxidoreductase [Anaerolineae bacterium]